VEKEWMIKRKNYPQSEVCSKDHPPERYPAIKTKTRQQINEIYFLVSLASTQGNQLNKMTE
jgi:hypothetical protein